MPDAYYDPCGYKNVSDFYVLIYIQVYQIWSIVPNINKNSVVRIYNLGILDKITSVILSNMPYLNGTRNHLNSQRFLVEIVFIKIYA